MPSIQPMMTVTPSPCLVFTSPNYSWVGNKNSFFPWSIGNCPSYFRRVTITSKSNPELCWLIPHFPLAQRCHLVTIRPGKMLDTLCECCDLGLPLADIIESAKNGTVAPAPSPLPPLPWQVKLVEHCSPGWSLLKPSENTNIWPLIWYVSI